MLRLKFGQAKNMFCIWVTRAVFQPVMSPLNAVAALNRSDISSTFDTSQPERD